MVKPRLKGMVLLTTISMIVLLTMLILSLMQAVLSYTRISNQVITQHDQLYALEHAASTLASFDEKGIESRCLLKEQNPNTVLAQLSKLGCLLKEGKNQYVYLISDLGIYPCLQIVSQKGWYSSHHWLISVALVANPKIILQLRITKPHPINTCERFKPREIGAGVVSFRSVVLS